MRRGTGVSSFSPAGLVIAVAVVGELAYIRTIGAHDEDLTGGLVLACDVGVGCEGDPFSVGREADTLRVGAVCEFFQVRTVEVHRIHVVCERTALVECNEIQR